MKNNVQKISAKICLFIMGMCLLVSSGCSSNTYSPFVIKDSVHNKEYVIKTTCWDKAFTSKIFCDKKLIHTLKGKVEEVAISQNNQYIALAVDVTPVSHPMINPNQLLIISTNDMTLKYQQHIGSREFTVAFGQQYTYWPNVLALAIDNTGENVIVFWSAPNESNTKSISRWSVEKNTTTQETIIEENFENEPIACAFSDIKIADDTGDVTFKTTFYAKDPDITLPPSYISKWNMLSGELVSEK